MPIVDDRPIAVAFDRRRLSFTMGFTMDLPDKAASLYSSARCIGRSNRIDVRRFIRENPRLFHLPSGHVQTPAIARADAIFAGAIMLVESCSELACELEAVFSAFDESGVERLSQALAKDGYSVPSPAGGGFATATQHAIRTTLDLMLSIDPPPLWTRQATAREIEIPSWIDPLASMFLPIGEWLAVNESIKQASWDERLHRQAEINDWLLTCDSKIEGHWKADQVSLLAINSALQCEAAAHLSIKHEHMAGLLTGMERKLFEAIVESDFTLTYEDITGQNTGMVVIPKLAEAFADADGIATVSAARKKVARINKEFKQHGINEVLEPARRGGVLVFRKKTEKNVTVT